MSDDQQGFTAADFYDDEDSYDPAEDPNVCPECGGDMTFVREGLYCCSNTNDCDYCLDIDANDAEDDGDYDRQELDHEARIR